MGSLVLCVRCLGENFNHMTYSGGIFLTVQNYNESRLYYTVYNFMRVV